MSGVTANGKGGARPRRLGLGFSGTKNLQALHTSGCKKQKALPYGRGWAFWGLMAQVPDSSEGVET